MSDEENSSSSSSDQDENDPADVYNTFANEERPRWIKYLTNEMRREDPILAYAIKARSEPELSMFVWARLSQVIPSSTECPWDFSKFSKTAPLWLPLWINFDDLETLRFTKDPLIDTSQFVEVQDPTCIIRATGDRTVTYGDGGSSDLTYPIWFCNRPSIDQSTRTELLADFLQLNEKRKDYQIVTPVEDIIDPDLGPYRTNSDYYTRTFNRLTKLNADLRELKRNTEYYKTKLSKSVQIRESYHWLPSEFLVTKEGNVSILSRIHNLPPRLKYAKMYKNIAKIFEGMVPMFKNLNIINKESDTKLQVIVKAQSYRLLPGMTYAGRWHVEGQTENIVAVGVYYLQVDDCLVGGKLKFRPANGPQENYSIKTDCELDVKEGSAVVFSNMIPHRFRKIVNNSHEEKRRTFLNFFIVDPSQPLKSTKEVPSTVLLSGLLQKAAEVEGKHLPKPLIQNILSFLPNVWANKTEAKRFRKTARDSMKTDTSGWGWINWGNCGTVEFVPAYSTWETRNRQECEFLQHTESDTPTI